MANPIRTTRCVAPNKRDSNPGEAPAIKQAAIYIVIGLILAGLVSWPLGSFLALGFFLGGVDSFIDWWLNRRLLCLGGERCAIGIVWSLEPPGEKEGLEMFDNDFSLNLLLSPANPGDRTDKLLTQRELVSAQADIINQNLPTFGYERVAARIRDGMSCPTVVGPMGVTDIGGMRDKIVSLLFQGDLKSDDVSGSNANSWENYTFPGSDPGLKPVVGSPIWALDDNDSNKGIELSSSSAPNTQLLHCEFEGTDISNLRGVLFWGGLIAGGALVSALPALSAAGPLAVAAGVIVFLLILLLLAFINLIRSHDGSPADSADDPLSGNPQPIPSDSLDSCKKWDTTFNLIGVMGRWVYDFGHTRGWNEIHPVIYVQLLATEATEANRQSLPVDPKDPSKGNLPPVRPKSESETQALRNLWCSEVAKARDPDFKDRQSDSLVDLHPQVHESEIK